MLRQITAGVLFVVGLLAALLSVAIFTSDRVDAIAEIQALLCGVIATTGFGSAAIVMAIEASRRQAAELWDLETRAEAARRRLERHRDPEFRAQVEAVKAEQAAAKKG